MKKRKEIAPGSRRPVKVPFIMQLEELECGAACLAMVLAYYGKWVPLEQIRKDCGISRDGSNAKNIMQAARNYGLEAKGFRIGMKYLQEKVTFPCIVFWSFNHFVVLNGFSGRKAVLNDPARGKVVVSMEEFDANYTGVCIRLTPGEQFEPGGKPASVISFARKRLKGSAPVFAFLFMTMAASAALGILTPVMSRVFIDRLLSGENPEWLTPFLTAMVVLTAFDLIIALFQTIYSLRINGKMSMAGTASYMWKVLRLPMEFFTQRSAGDIQLRMDTNATIAETVVNLLVPFVINSIMMLFYLFVMLKNSVILTAIGVGTMLINALVIRYTAIRRTNVTRVQMRDAGKKSSCTMSGILMIESIKASGAEEGYFQKWAGYQAAVNAQDVEAEKIEMGTGIIPGLLSELADLLVLSLGVWLCMNGRFTEGMIFAFQSFLHSFMNPAQDLASIGQQTIEMRTSMERVEDVMEYPSDPVCEKDSLSEEENYAKLSGSIRMEHVTFGYSRLSKPLIEDFSMELKPGSRVAFVGPSGCGKSTLSKLISGLYQPWEGRILFDGKTIDEIDHGVFTGSLTVVDQDIILFEDSIASNIRMWDTSIENFEIILAARDARIHEDIMRRPGGYEGLLTENGTDLSGGQRQRIEIARVLSQDPTIIILDEATSALDAKTEYDVIQAIQARGITCIIIAHRLSTIRDCDEIIVLDEGKVVERGTHEKLYAQNGVYRELVTSE